MPSEIVDAHVYLGGTSSFESQPETLLAAMNQYGVSRAVLGGADRWLAVDNAEGNDALVRAVRSWPDRFLGYASANPWYGVRAVTEVERVLDVGLHGLKLLSLIHISEPTRQ